jgi:hypothetical protein
MSLGIFGLLLVAGLTALCWKNGRCVGVALCALMLGMTIAASDGILHRPASALVGAVRSTISALGSSIGGDH